MEELNNFDYNNEVEKAEPQAEETSSQLEEVKEAQEPVIEPEEEIKEQQEPQPTFIPPYNPINYTAIKPIEDRKPMSQGLKMFALIMVAVIALTSACAAGYFLGRGDSGNKGAVVGLEAKPKDNDEMTASQVYEKVNPSVVGICVYNSKGKGANASGVIYSSDGYIVTNDHIYSDIGAAKFKIYTYDGKEYDAKYIAGDKVSDLAVLKIDSGKFTPAVLGNSEEIIFGENVVAIGRPGGASDSSSITKGIISATSRRVQTTSNYSSRLIETDTPINPGSSGGALVNMYGQVVGITSSKLASSDIDAVGYAIPTTTVKRIVEELIKTGSIVTRAKLGITYQAIDSVTASISNYKYEGLYVDSVAADSDLYGKISKGDIITHINGIEVTSDVIVLDIIEKAKAGDKIRVTFVNEKGGSKTIDAVLKANVSESSYSQIEQEDKLPDFSGGQNGGEFNFPFGE
ncbi:MAG: trypsin-like peptidase domain-containing protein [Clostridia bacterium]|nr:trypsin-like peptidase domain-containing protein [Clostridia bacterium]